MISEAAQVDQLQKVQTGNKVKPKSVKWQKRYESINVLEIQDKLLENIYVVTIGK